MKRIIGFILLLATISGTLYLYYQQVKPRDSVPDLSTPSPLLGQTVANALHQAMSDPYLLPFEKAIRYLNRNPESTYIDLSQLSSWVDDDEFPTFFTFEIEIDKFSFDKPTSAWAVDAVKSELYRKVYSTKLAHSPRIVILDFDGERWWMGAIVVSDGLHSAPEVVGAFFNLDTYLKEHVPRFIDNVVKRKRFPLISFQTSELLGGVNSGQIAIRILDDQKSVYLQRGHNFEPELLIYAESKWYDNTVVCLNAGWDLQVFSVTPMTEEDIAPNLERNLLLLLIIMLGLISLIYWWSTAGMGKMRQPEEHE